MRGEHCRSHGAYSDGPVCSIGRNLAFGSADGTIAVLMRTLLAILLTATLIAAPLAAGLRLGTGCCAPSDCVVTARAVVTVVAVGDGAECRSCHDRCGVSGSAMADDQRDDEDTLPADDEGDGGCSCPLPCCTAAKTLALADGVAPRPGRAPIGVVQVAGRLVATPAHLRQLKRPPRDVHPA